MSTGVSTDVEWWTCQARRQGWGLTEEVARRWGGGEISAQRRSAVKGGQTAAGDAPRYTCGSMSVEGEMSPEPKWAKWGGGSTVAALTSERGRRRWRAQIPDEGRRFDGGGGCACNKGWRGRRWLASDAVGSRGKKGMEGGHRRLSFGLSRETAGRGAGVKRGARR
jgi:hypothetical protein